MKFAADPGKRRICGSTSIASTGALRGNARRSTKTGTSTSTETGTNNVHSVLPVQRTPTVTFPVLLTEFGANVSSGFSQACRRKRESKRAAVT
jgi:hypothetical protein